MNRINDKNIIAKLQSQQSVRNDKNKTNNEFASVLADKLKHNESKIKFSKHAMDRIETREIELEDDDLVKIAEAIEKAEQKGIKNSVIISDKAVYIANIKSKTIITAMEDMKDRVFTNVDGVINI